jgi:hypothetical protein
MRDPHLTKPTRGTSYVAKDKVLGRMKVISDSMRENREMQLIIQKSRAVAEKEIHEVIVTAEEEAQPGAIVNTVAYQGFFEVRNGGLISIGDHLSIGNKFIGKVCGFDETHYPNHINIVVSTEKLATGLGNGLELGDEVVFFMADPEAGKSRPEASKDQDDLRITEHPILENLSEDRKTVTITIDGQKIQAYEGEPIAAALWARGIKELRQTPRFGENRGIYCGIGRCTDCMMTVDGVPNVRTCVTPVADGMVIETQNGLGRWS